MTDTRPGRVRVLLRHPFFMIGVLALALRLATFMVMSAQLGADADLSRLTPDARHYVTAGEAIRGHWDFDTHGVLMFGPGYPTALAAAGVPVGGHPAGLTLLQILLGALTAGMLCVLTWRLTGDRRVAAVTGGLYACSASAVGLSVLLLSDTFFFALFVGSLLALLHAIRTERWRDYALAGLLFGICALTRSLGQLLPVIVVVVVLGYAVGSGSRWSWNLRQRGVGLLITILVSTAVFVPWIIRNKQQYDMPYLAKSALMGQAKLAALIKSEADHSRYESEFQQFLNSRDAKGRVADSSDEAFAMLAPRMLREMVKRHPFTSVRVFLDNAYHNAHTEWGVLTTVFPQWDDTIRKWTGWIEGRGLKYRVLILSLFGMWLLIRHAQYGLLLILGSIYVYFMLMSGFTVWQGNRIFHPAILAWGPLVAMVMVDLWERLQHRRRRSRVLPE